MSATNDHSGRLQATRMRDGERAESDQAFNTRAQGIYPLTRTSKWAILKRRSTSDWEGEKELVDRQQNCIDRWLDDS